LGSFALGHVCIPLSVSESDRAFAACSMMKNGGTVYEIIDLSFIEYYAPLFAQLSLASRLV
jgi:hypothetical protein